MKAPVPMHGPGIDTAGDADEGGCFARDFLARVAAGTSGPDDLVSVLAFMHSGPMLHGFCAVPFHTLRQLLTQGGGQ